MKISIITVVYNAENTIEDTIKSVISQDFKGFEYIIVDGRSTDGTVSIIQKFRNCVTQFISEKDSGVYDAMNKAIHLAKGDWLIFINSGDSLYTNTTIREAYELFNDYNGDVVYGDTNYIYTNNFSKIAKASNIGKMKYFLPFCHQSVFVKTEIMKELLFDTKYQICADYDFFYKIHKMGKEFKYINKVISNYNLVGGLSSSNVIKMIRERSIINHSQNSIFYPIKLLFYKLRILMKKIMPASLVVLLRSKFDFFYK